MCSLYARFCTITSQGEFFLRNCRVGIVGVRVDLVRTIKAVHWLYTTVIKVQAPQLTVGLGQYD